jgi:hypothetical protein
VEEWRENHFHHHLPLGGWVVVVEVATGRWRWRCAVGMLGTAPGREARMGSFQITGMRPISSKPGAEGEVLAYFDIDFDRIIVRNCALIRRPDGELRVSPKVAKASRSRRDRSLSVEFSAEWIAARTLKLALAAYRATGGEVTEA